MFRIEDAVTIERARELAENGELKAELHTPDYALGHLKRMDVPAGLRKLVVNGAKLPVLKGTGLYQEGEPVRIYLDGNFWGIAVKQEKQMIWRALIAPEDESEEMK